MQQICAALLSVHIVGQKKLSMEPDLEAEVGGQQNNKDVQRDGRPYQDVQRAKAPCLVIQLQTDGRDSIAAGRSSAEAVTSSAQAS